MSISRTLKLTERAEMSIKITFKNNNKLIIRRLMQFFSRGTRYDDEYLMSI
ncbi:MAG: hypothetical protein NVS3B3_03650 [Aquirhabdus sp.]